MKTACQQNKQRQDAGLSPLPVCVNLSLNQFQNPQFIDNIKQILTECQLEPRWLMIEVTESIVMDDLNYSLFALKKLNDLVVNLSLDDFGIGLGSLSCLQKFTINTIKIHQSFIHDLNSNPTN